MAEPNGRTGISDCWANWPIIKRPSVRTNKKSFHFLPSSFLFRRQSQTAAASDAGPLQAKGSIRVHVTNGNTVVGSINKAPHAAGSHSNKRKKSTDRTTRLLVAILILFLLTEFPQVGFRSKICVFWSFLRWGFRSNFGE